MSWDAIVQASERTPLQIVEPGASLTLSLPHRVGGALPDQVKITAGIYAASGEACRSGAVRSAAAREGHLGGRRTPGFVHTAIRRFPSKKRRMPT
jgi:hypothetical protein